MRSATIMGPKGWQDMRRSSDNYFIAKGGVFKCALTSHDQRLFCLNEDIVSVFYAWFDFYCAVDGRMCKH